MKKLIFAVVALSALSAPAHAIAPDVIAFCKGDEKCELVMKIYAQELVMSGKMETICKYKYEAAGESKPQHCGDAEANNKIIDIEAEEAARIADEKYLSGGSK